MHRHTHTHTHTHTVQGVQCTAYSPLGGPNLVKPNDLINNPVVAQVAKQANKTPAQVFVMVVVCVFVCVCACVCVCTFCIGRMACLLRYDAIVLKYWFCGMASL